MTKNERIKELNKHKKMLMKTFKGLDDRSGIYIYIRHDNDFKYAYVGQSKHLVTRLAEHMMGFEQHIDKSLKKRGLFSVDNPTGWNIRWLHFDEKQLNQKEQDIIKTYANAGFQLLNKTTGSQGVGKAVLGEFKERKGYQEGVAYGYLKARRYIAGLFEKNLVCSINGKDGVLKQKAMAKFKEFIDLGEEK